MCVKSVLHKNPPKDWAVSCAHRTGVAFGRFIVTQLHGPVWGARYDDLKIWSCCGTNTGVLKSILFFCHRNRRAIAIKKNERFATKRSLILGFLVNYAADAALRRHPMKPKKASTLARSGSAAGIGTGASGSPCRVMFVLFMVVVPPDGCL